MKKIQHIVAATDFSSPANAAVNRAALLAQVLEAELHIIHVVHPLDLYAGAELSYDFQMHYQETQQQTIKTKLEHMRRELSAQFKIKIETSNRLGRAHTEIANYAVSCNAGLIVAGAQGENSLLAKLLGSTAMRLLKTAKCPILIVKETNQQFQRYQQIVAAIDLLPGSMEVPAAANSIAPEANIELLLIFDSNQEAHLYKAGIDETLLIEYRAKALAHAEQKLDGILSSSQNPRMTRHIMRGYPPEAISDRAKAVQADLIVLGKHNTRNIEEWLLGSVSKGIAHSATCDVLLLNNG